MRARATIVITAVAVAVLGIAAPAFAKGPDQATITGPGLSAPIVVTGNGEPGSSEALGELCEGSGLFRYIFQSADGSGAPLTVAPGGNLGPKYLLTYRIPDGSTNGSTFHQDIYPFAPGGPVTFTASGQTVFGSASGHGWFRTDPAFSKVLTRIGVPGPSAAPTAAPPTSAPPRPWHSRPAPPDRPRTGRSGSPSPSSRRWYWWRYWSPPPRGSGGPTSGPAPTRRRQPCPRGDRHGVAPYGAPP